MGRGAVAWRVPRRASALLVLLLAVVVLGPTTAVRADFATQCATPDRTVAAGDTSIAVAPGETVLVATGFTGGIDALPAGGTLCVAPGATLTGLYLNNAAGAVVVAAGGALELPSVAVSAGFSLELEGTASFAGLNVNGAAFVHVAAGAELTVLGSFSPAAGTFLNEGTFQVEGAIILNGPVAFENTGTLSVLGSATVNGPLVNAGLATFAGGLTVNGSGALHNTCTVEVTGDLAHNGTGSTNGGLVEVSGNLANNGTWSQTHDGLVGAVGLTDDGAVTGYGGFRFSGSTSVQGSFVGDSPDDPVRVQSVAPPGQVFDVQTGTVANASRSTVDLPSSLPACAALPGPGESADVEVSKSGPATVLEGGVVTYAVTVRNGGRAAAADVVVTDPLPAGFALDPASTTGSLVGGSLVWQLGTLAADQVVTLTFSGAATAAAGSTLLNVVSSTSTTVDPTPANNDGSSGSSRVSTEVVAAPPPPNQPPVADDLTRDTTTGVLVVGAVTASDPDPGQTLRFTLATAPANGTVYLSPSGGLVYVSDRDFAGIETFMFEACDNASPTPACDTATVTVNVRPRATDDVAVTSADTPVVVPVVSNDTAGAPLDPVVVTSPANGSVTLDPASGAAVYTPTAGFTGTDTFVYRICSPTEPTFCDTATVVVDVLPPNLPPTVAPLTLTTTVGAPVAGTLDVADSNAGDVVTTFVGVPPRTGTASVGPDGSTVYRPRAGFAGRDFYGDVVCDDGIPQLCTTGRVTVEVLPVAVADAATTPEGTPVDVEIGANDQGAVVRPTWPRARPTGRSPSPGARRGTCPPRGSPARTRSSTRSARRPHRTSARPRA
ncbi:DUF11 domain-containing protein [Cellulomonas humilata]|uniref:DUF11 domain-containing protein n=1 Tax=Cellulomonas humilata TaxID=144055 RepID=A0A7Y6A1U9_9CELL|nr:Ig-like domain-containing protein [Cellulomonas humilata]NUU18239.1 DUF11 domain-containing protein [Cellulomonas humilata]